MVKALDRKLLRDLGSMKGQMLTIGLVVACGVAVFVAMRSMHASLEYSRSTYYERYRFGDVFAGMKRAPEGLAARIERLAGVEAVMTRVVEEVPLEMPEMSEPAVARLISLPEHGSPPLNEVFLREGRMPEPDRPDEVLVSEAFAQAHHLEPGDSLTAVLNGRRQQLRLVGTALSPEYVFQIRGGDAFPDDRRFGVFWMPRDALAAAFDMKGAFNDMVIGLAPGGSEPEVIARLDRLLEPYGGLGAYGRDEQLSNRYVSEELRQLRTSATTVPAIFLGVAAFLINVVLSRLVGMQREQIAALKALGYSNRNVGLHYLKFVMVIVLLGAVVGFGIGAGMGLALARLYARFFRFPVLLYSFRVDVAVVGAAVSAAAALAGAISEVRKAVLLPPAEAMRPPAPPTLNPTVLERLGLQRFLSQGGRMVLRNLARRPARLMLSSIAIAFSVAIVVVGRFQADSVDYLMDVQYRLIQREDLTVSFFEPLPARACRDLEHLEGVLYCEPVRSVPVELRVGHRKQRTGIIGLEAGAQLRQLLDTRLKRIHLPPEGLVLNAYLGEELGIHPGDRVRVKVLEGERKELHLPVVALADELIGISAYMNLEALNRALGEAPVISGGLLLIDPARSGEVFRALKGLPTTASALPREAALKAFRETSGRTLLVVSLILAAFASVIAIGVVYNNARIALSERARELASLRVLGFTRAEISVLLLAELAIQLLLALPVGAVLGYGLAHALVRGARTELYRFPVVIEPGTYLLAMGVVVAAGAISAMLVRRKLDRLDLVAVLKTRE